MKKNNNKKIFSVFAVLAITATAALGSLSLAGCGDKSFEYNPVSDGQNAAAKTFSTALGTVAQSEGRQLYIAVDGKSAQNGGDGSEAKPYDINSLGDANLYQAGDTILIKPGVYKTSQSISINYSGTFDKYITIKNASATTGLPSEAVVIDFSEQKFDSTLRGVHIYGSFIYWYGIDVCGAGDNGLYISGSYNTVEYSEFYNNRDTGLQLGRAYSDQSSINQWPSYNLIKNCTSHNNYDNETAGENADGFAAKLTVGYGNVFDGCIAYRNSDDGWDLYAKTESGNIGAVIIYNCVAFENGYLEYTQAENNARFPNFNTEFTEANPNSYKTNAGDGNGFKLGGSVMEGDVVIYNCLAFNNRMHGVTDNSNPGVLSLDGITSYDNAAGIDDNPLSATFGQIVAASAESCNNIDVSRQTYSYNNLNRVLSVKSAIGQNLGADAYRASVRNSLLGTEAKGTKAYKIESAIDADSKNGVKGVEVNAPVAADVFEKLPIVKNAEDYTFNLSGLKDLGTYTDANDLASATLNAQRVHKIYRNADGSVNMKGVLEVKDYSKLLGVDNKIGSVLSGANYGAYTHFYALDNVSGATDNAARLARIKEALTINCDANAVYQDFDVPAKMTGATISWASSDANVLKIGTDKDTSLSGSEYITVGVYRQSEDKTVTLTATLDYNGEQTTKAFTVTVKRDEPSVGAIYAVTADGDRIEDGNIIVDAYMLYEEPEIRVENGADYNGKLLNASQYDVVSSYFYAPDKNSKPFEIKSFTPSTPGVYTVTKKVNIKGESKSKTFSYYIYVASPDANVDFVEGNVSVTVNRDGFIIEGALSNVTGSLYALSSATQLELTKETIKTQAGVENFAFRGESIRAQLTNANSAEYFVYYAVANVNGDITSEIYETKINVVSVPDIATFTKVVKGEAVNGETPAETIYLLTADLDFAENGAFVGSGTFKGLLNGNGHTIKNITATTSVISKINGGTVMNLKVENLTINSTAERAGFIGSIHGGYVHNVQLKNVSVNSTRARVGGLIGQAEEGFTYISQVSLINENKDLSIETASASNRVGGIIGYIQSNTAPDSELYISISDCYVDAKFAAGSEVGGIVGSYNCNNSALTPFYMSIDHCVFAGEVWAYTTSSLRVAGILGYHANAGSSKLVIHSCLSIGKSFMGSTDAKASIDAAVKNASAIVGGYDASADADVYNCVGLLDEHNSNFRVDQFDMASIAKVSTFGEYMLNFDTTEKWTLIVDGNDDTALTGRLITLNFLD